MHALHLSHRGLIALQAPAHLSAGALPTRIVMLRWGANETSQGACSVGLKTLQASKLWAGLGYGEVPIDFNHNTVPGHASYKGEPAAIAAMATPGVIEGEGLVFENIEWTQEGRDNCEHYPDLSPAVKIDDDGEVIFVHSAALARNGAVAGLHLFSAASVPPLLAEKLRNLAQANGAADESFAEKINALLRHFLGLAVSASTDEIAQSLVDFEARYRMKMDAEAAAGKPLATMNADVSNAQERVNRALGISETTWRKYNPAGVTTLAAETPAFAEETVRRRLGISRETWTKYQL